MSIFIVIPCYKVKKKIYKVISKSLKYVDKIIIVDDKCPEQTGAYVKKKIKNKKVLVLFNKKNQGVGGAMKKGYKAAIKLNAKIIDEIKYKSLSRNIKSTNIHKKERK